MNQKVAQEILAVIESGKGSDGLSNGKYAMLYWGFSSPVAIRASYSNQTAGGLMFHCQSNFFSGNISVTRSIYGTYSIDFIVNGQITISKTNVEENQVTATIDAHVDHKDFEQCANPVFARNLFTGQYHHGSL